MSLRNVITETKKTFKFLGYENIFNLKYFFFVHSNIFESTSYENIFQFEMEKSLKFSGYENIFESKIQILLKLLDWENIFSIRNNFFFHVYNKKNEHIKKIPYSSHNS